MSLPNLNSIRVHIHPMPPVTDNATITQTVDGNGNRIAPGDGAIPPYLSPVSSDASTLLSPEIVTPHHEGSDDDDFYGDADSSIADWSPTYEGSNADGDDVSDTFVEQDQDQDQDQDQGATPPYHDQGATPPNVGLGLHETMDQRALDAGLPAPPPRPTEYHWTLPSAPQAPQAPPPLSSPMGSSTYQVRSDMPAFVTGKSTAMVRSTPVYDSDSDGLYRTRRHKPIARDPWWPAVINRLLYMDALYWLSKLVEQARIHVDEYQYRKNQVAWISSEGLLMTYPHDDWSWPVPRDYVFPWTTPEDRISEHQYASLSQARRDALAQWQACIWITGSGSRASRPSAQDQ